MMSALKSRAGEMQSLIGDRRDLTHYGTIGVLAACLGAILAVLLSGCSGASAHAVDPSRARNALVAALDHWKQGDDPTSLPSSTTPMTVQDFDWQGGAKLVDYQVLDEGQTRAANLSIKVKLTMAPQKGGKYTEKTVYYLVGTSPSVTVFRDMLKR
jgi:hypothetical protein